MDDIDFGILQDSTIVIGCCGLIAGPFLDQSRCEFGAAAVGIKDTDVVAVLFEVWSRSVGTLESRSFLAPAASGTDGCDPGPIVGLPESFCAPTAIGYPHPGDG